MDGIVFLNLVVVYRLDRLTSGLLILAKNHQATNKLISDIKERRTVKTYLCKVEGQFPELVDAVTPGGLLHSE